MQPSQGHILSVESNGTQHPGDHVPHVLQFRASWNGWLYVSHWVPIMVGLQWLFPIFVDQIHHSLVKSSEIHIVWCLNHWNPHSLTIFHAYITETPHFLAFCLAKVALLASANRWQTGGLGWSCWAHVQWQSVGPRCRNLNGKKMPVEMITYEYCYCYYQCYYFYSYYYCCCFCFVFCVLLLLLLFLLLLLLLWYCEQMDPCSGCSYWFAIPVMLVLPDNGTAWQAELTPFLAHGLEPVRRPDAQWCMCITSVLAFSSLWHPPCPWYSSNHGHERGNFELYCFCYLNYAYVHKTCHSAPPSPHARRE